MQEKRAFRVLPASSIVAEKIESVYPDLTEALRTFADFVLAEPLKVARLSINETVHASGVSVATANRFARRLGYDGYPQFRAEVIAAFEDALLPVERLRRRISDGVDPREMIAASYQEDIDNLQNTMANLDMVRVEALARRMVSAQRVYILGFDNSAALGMLFAHRLIMAGIDARMAWGGRLSVARDLGLCGPDDVVLAIAFPRYLRDTLELAREAAGRGLRVVAITDNQASPLARIAEGSIYLQARRTIGSTSDTAILCFLEALASLVSALRPGAAEASERFAGNALRWMATKSKPD